MPNHRKDLNQPVGLRLRLTTWPLGSVPEPRIERYPRAERTGEWIWLGRGEECDAPIEVSTRQARDIDLDDLDALTDFVRTTGGAPDLTGIDINFGRPPLIEAFSRHHGRTYGKPTLGERGKGKPPDDLKGVQGGEWGRIIHVDEIALRLDLLRGLGMFMLARQRGEPVLDVANQWRPFEPPDHMHWIDHTRYTMFDLPGQDRTEASVLRTFTELWNKALSRFHARVWVLDQSTPAEPVTILESGALQLFNDFVTGAAYVPCKRCGRDFNRQIGRAKNRTRIEGTVYCQRSCANAATQAAWRARNRGEGGTNGTSA